MSMDLPVEIKTDHLDRCTRECDPIHNAQMLGSVGTANVVRDMSDEELSRAGCAVVQLTCIYGPSFSGKCQAGIRIEVLDDQNQLLKSSYIGRLPEESI